jgi:glycosyltransferase involved in cell wall biosynthesis
MRIAYIIPTPTPFSFIYNEMVEVQAAGHDLVILPLHREKPSKVPLRIFNKLKPHTTLTASLLDATIMRLAVSIFFSRPLHVVKILFSLHREAGLNLFAHAGILAVLPKGLAAGLWFSELKVDRIHAHFASHTATCAGIASLVSGIPFSFTAHAYDIYCTSLHLRNKTLDWKVRHAIQVFAISEHGKALLSARSSHFNRHSVQRVYVGIPMDLFKERAPSLVDGDFKLLCVASFDRKKGLNTLLDACAALKERRFNFSLHLYGEGPLREALSDQIARLELSRHVGLRGPIPQEEVAKELEACHVFVMPCRRDPVTGNIDGIPTVFMEAMATGRPVISCPVAGIPELVRHGETGLLIQPDDCVALAEAIIQLKADDSARILLGRQARKLVEKQHDQRTNTRQLLDLMTIAQFHNQCICSTPP